MGRRPRLIPFWEGVKGVHGIQFVPASPKEKGEEKILTFPHKSDAVLSLWEEKARAVTVLRGLLMGYRGEKSGGPLVHELPRMMAFFLFKKTRLQVTFHRRQKGREKKKKVDLSV